MLINLNLHTELRRENNICEKCKYLQVFSLFLSFNSLTIKTCQGNFLFPVLVMKNPKINYTDFSLIFFTSLSFNFSVHVI